MRKLISIATLLIYTTVNAQNFQQYQFQPQYQSQSGEYASESSLYLPPETQTTLPYFPLKGSNNLPYQYLPPTGTKAPSVYPSPFPVMMSSIVPNFDDDDEDDDGNDNNIRLSSPKPQNNFKLRPNATQNNGVQHHSDKREMRSLPKTVSYNHPIDRIDIKFPLKMGPTQPPQMVNIHNPSNRRMIMENVKSEPLMGDQVKTASYHGVQYIQPPPGYLVSTTEPAIPILRLSNEMDLDGSYSYEALGADQTHYVQHSRMENMGTDKEEQVVEGSYSYVGDNGQTYTVHYVADANGFRASGDHLPVGPPVPEIIQRSIQYNLAEEAKKPPHLQGWHDEERTNEIDGRDRIQRFPASPSRGLFTGRTPEAFSYNFAKAANTQNNNIVPAPSSPAPVIAHLDQHKDQPPQQGNAPISPQITFLASQGAHVPSMNTNPMPQPQNIARVFNTNNDKSSMPKLMNYEFTTIENEHENNKPLWRWQYGLNANAGKHLISRSSGYNEDEVSMNFSEMSPEQYKLMIHSQFVENGNNDNRDRYDSPVSSTPIVSSTEYENLPINHKNIEPVEYQISTMRSIYDKQINEKKHVPITPYISNWQDRSNDENIQSHIIHDNMPSHEHNNYQNKAPKLITQNDFLPPNQMVTQSYDYDESYYEPRKLKSPRSNIQKNNESENNIQRPVPKNEPPSFSVYTEPDKAIVQENFSENPTISVEYTTPIAMKPKEWIPLRPVIEDEEYVSDQNEIPSSTTEKSMDEILKTNIFLKNALAPKQQNNIVKKDIIEKEFSNEKKHQTSNPDSENIRSDEKVPKSLQSYQQPLDDIKFMRKRPLDMSDVLNYYATKNQFESSKIRPKFQKNIHFANKPDIPINFPHSKLGEGNYYNNDNKNDNKENQSQEKPNLIVKKYKTLQRNNNFISDQGNREIRRDLSPPPQDYKNIPNLPPLGRAGPTLKSYLPPIFV